jgi:hypothetical protein
MKKLLVILSIAASLYATALQCLALPVADTYAQCRLPEMGVRSDVGLGFPRIPR